MLQSAVFKIVEKPRWIVHRGFLHDDEFVERKRGLVMNTQERRQFVRGQVIDVAVAKAAINRSRRERAEAAKLLRKAMANKQFAARQVDSISYPQAS